VVDIEMRASWNSGKHKVAVIKISSGDKTNRDGAIPFEIALNPILAFFGFPLVTHAPGRLT